MHKIFIDGQVGTTGLQIQDRLLKRPDIELLTIADNDRKNPAVKRDILAAADVAILCLPDEAARETVQLAGETTRFIDASTAHRVNPDWVFGLPELRADQRSQIKSARMVSNAGCYASGFLLLIAPLIERSLLNPSSLLTISALSGYSGGGRQMIEKYEQRTQQHIASPDDHSVGLWHSRPYALQLRHKHLPEMKHYARLDQNPLFLPSVGHFAQGMLVSVGLFREFFRRPVTPADIVDVLETVYRDEPCVNVYGPNDDSQCTDGFLDPELNNGTNRMDIFVFGHEDQVVLVSRLDNLGKGASGLAVQNLNLMLGTPELEGLTLD